MEIVDSLSAYLTETYGRGFSRNDVAGMRQFYMAYNKVPFKISWTHYQVLMRREDSDERDFYDIEAIRSNWNVNTLKRQFHSSV